MRFGYAIQILFVLSVCRASALASASAEIPFQFRDGLIWIGVNIPGSQEPLRFLLDSGAQVSVINTATAVRLGLKGGRPVTVQGVGGASTGYWPQTLDARAGGTQLPRSYLVVDLSELSRACTNAALDGIIGADFFQNRIARIDFEKQTVCLLREPPAEAGMQVLPLKVRHCGMLVPVRVNNSAPQWLRLDTGCACAMQWVTGSIRPEACTRRMAVALTSFSVPVTQTTVALGTARFEDVPTDVEAKEIFPGEKGLLGNGVLSRFKTVTIDARGGKLVLGPRFLP